MQKQNSPLINANLGVREGSERPEGLPCPQPHNKHQRHKEGEAGGWQVCHCHPQQQLRLSHSQPVLGLRRNPRAAPPGARPGHLQAQQDGIYEFGIVELLSLGTRPRFPQDRADFPPLPERV